MNSYDFKGIGLVLLSYRIISNVQEAEAFAEGYNRYSQKYKIDTSHILEKMSYIFLKKGKVIGGISFAYNSNNYQYKNYIDNAEIQQLYSMNNVIEYCHLWIDPSVSFIEKIWFYRQSFQENKKLGKNTHIAGIMDKKYAKTFELVFKVRIAGGTKLDFSNKRTNYLILMTSDPCANILRASYAYAVMKFKYKWRRLWKCQS